jgi:hypothetical protein
MYVKQAILVVLSCSIGAPLAKAQCPKFEAPSKFENPWPKKNTEAYKKYGGDIGPIVKGFINSRRPDQKGGGVYDVAHGIDVAENKVLYSEIKDCGGEFALVRMSHSNHCDRRPGGPCRPPTEEEGAGDKDEYYPGHIVALSKNGVVAIPYFWFELPEALTKITMFQALEESQESSVEQFRVRYVEYGTRAAEKFGQYAKELSTESSKVVHTVHIAGLDGQFVALDVEQDPCDDTKRYKNNKQLCSERQSSARQKAKAALKATGSYGRFYAAAVCSWVKGVKARFPGIIPILYTSPNIYRDYLQFADPDDNNCLRGLPVWIARYTDNGWEAVQDPSRIRCERATGNNKDYKDCKTDLLVKEFCAIGRGVNRCIVHQYTARGIAMVVHGREKKGQEEHLQMDRLYRSRKWETSNHQFVYGREENAFKP